MKAQAECKQSEISGQGFLRHGKFVRYAGHSWYITAFCNGRVFLERNV